MKISARNQIEATIETVNKGAVNAQVTLKMPQGTMLSATVTNASVDSMGLEANEKVTAFFKASNVLLSKSPNPTISARNRLTGRVGGVKHGAVNAEMTIVLEGGDAVTSIVTNDAVTELGLGEGDAVTAIIKSTDVMIAKGA